MKRSMPLASLLFQIGSNAGRQLLPEAGAQRTL
jgi:hypothetical protein